MIIVWFHRFVLIRFLKAADVAENLLELKEETEKGKLAPMNKDQRYKQFDLFSTLAVFGAIAVFLFEGFFVFELYSRDVEPLNRFLPEILNPAPVSVPKPVEEPAPVG